MKILVNRKNFIEILTDLSIIIKENPIRPVISGAKLLASEDGKIEFTGTTLEMSFVAKMDADIEEAGTVVFRVPLVLEYVKLIDEEKIEIRKEDNKLFIHNAEFSIFDADDYPKIKTINADTEFEIDMLDLNEGFDKVGMAASTSTENLALNCVRIESFEDHIHFVASDTYRLAYYKIEINDLREFGVSIPLEAVNAIIKIFKGFEGKINFKIEGSYLELTTHDIKLSTRLIDMSFPDYRAIMLNLPKDKVIETNREIFQSALKKVLTVAKINQETKDAALFNFNANKLTMLASSGRAKTNQQIDIIKDGDDLKASLNVRYILDYISRISENVIINALNSSSMFVIKEYKNPNYYYILMPLALREQ